MTLGDRIKRLRDERGMTQSQLADMCGVNRNSIYMYERNNVQPKQDILGRIADALDVSLAYLLGISDISDDETLEWNTEKITKAIFKNIDIEEIINNSLKQIVNESIEKVLIAAEKSHDDDPFLDLRELFAREGFETEVFSNNPNEKGNIAESIYLVQNDNVCYKFKFEDIKELRDATQAFFGFQLKKIISRAIETINKIDK